MERERECVWCMRMSEREKGGGGNLTVEIDGDE